MNENLKAMLDDLLYGNLLSTPVLAGETMACTLGYEDDGEYENG